MLVLGIFALNGLQGQFFDARSSFSSLNAAAQAVDVSSDGEYFVTGHFDDFLDLTAFSGPVLTSTYGIRCGFVICLDQSGNYVWGAKIESQTSDASGMDIDYDEKTRQVFATGYFEGTLDVYDDMGANLYWSHPGWGGKDFWVLTFDGGGAYIDCISAGGLNEDGAEGIKVSANTGTVALAGYYTDDFSMESNSSGVFATGMGVSSGTVDAFGITFDVGFSSISSRSYVSGSGVNRAYSIGMDFAQNFVYCGSFDQTADFYDGTSAYSGSITTWGGWDGFIMSNKIGGSLNWISHQAGAGEDQNFDIFVTEEWNNPYDGYVFYTGRHTDDLTIISTSGMNLVPHQSGTSINDAHLGGLDQSGSFVWAHNIYSTGGSIGRQRGNIGYSVHTEGNNFDELFFCGQVHGRAYHDELNGNPPSYIQTSNGVLPLANAMESFVVRVNNPIGACNYSGGRVFANSLVTVTPDANPAYGVHANVNGEVTLVGKFINPGSDWSPFVLNPGSCTTAPCDQQMYFSRILSSTFKNGSTDFFTVVPAERHFSLYPNPGNNQVTLTFGDQLEEGSTIRLMDVNGRVLQQMQTARELAVVQLDTKELATGMYYISIQAKGQAPQTLKWVKE